MPGYRLRLLSFAALAFAACAESAPSPMNHRDLAMDNVDNRDYGVILDLAVTLPDLTNFNYDLFRCPDCNDNVDCTADVCQSDGTCAHFLDHSKCGDSEVCTSGGCAPIKTTGLCSACTSDINCNADEVCGSGGDADGGTVMVCLPKCGPGVGCPKGFSCDNSKTPARCAPLNLCCFDFDGDERGVGTGCRGTDCDDKDDTKFPGKPELCDNKDNDCDGDLDEGYLCGGPKCAEVQTTGTYAENPARTCQVGNCTDEPVVPCGLYTCEPVPSPVPGDKCRTNCPSADTAGDVACINPAFCDGAACTPRLPDGNICNRNRQCESNHCNNGFCCRIGEVCCQVPSDCPSSFEGPPLCDASNYNCQGTKKIKTCALAVCGSEDEQNDSGCGMTIQMPCGDPPGSLMPVKCNGQPVQVPLVCPTNCVNDQSCANPSTMWCNMNTGKCEAKKPNGNACGPGSNPPNNQCVSGHCQNGFCCASGDCCAAASQCPAGYAQGSICSDVTTPTDCQGTRKDKSCSASFQCGSVTVADDTACGTGIKARECNAYKDKFCSGGSAQGIPACDASCVNDTPCDTPANHCWGGICQRWREQGESCSAAGECRTGFCRNNVCCNTACNNTTCDFCGSGGWCSPYSDSSETNACWNSPYLGSNHFSAQVTGTIQNSSDTEDWFRIYASDEYDACFWPIEDYGHLRVWLDVPAGMDYDLEVYKASDNFCNGLSLRGASRKGVGQQDYVDIREDCGGEDGGYYVIKVIKYNGYYTCSARYTVTVSSDL